MFSVAVGQALATRMLDHLLQHVRQGVRREELLLGTYVESTGHSRRTAILSEVLWPRDSDTLQTSVGTTATPAYLTRAVRKCQAEGKGLFMIHNHLTPGWQDLSWTDRDTEQGRLADLARITKKPFVGLTTGSDGTLSARWWTRPNGNRQPPRLEWCSTVRRVTGGGLIVDHAPVLGDLRPILEIDRYRRRLDTWGRVTQDKLRKLRVALIGAGSVGMLVAEALGRIGVERLTILDPDSVQAHNLDRLVGGSDDWIGDPKAHIAQAIARRALGAAVSGIQGYPLSVESEAGWQHLLDADIAFTCVDSAVARDIANHVAIGHAIPVIEGGVRVEKNRNDRLVRAHYIAAWISPETACIRCIGQYNTGEIGTERKTAQRPGYVQGGTSSLAAGGNVFVFAMGCAQQQLEMFVRNVLGEDWWGHPSLLRRQVVTASQRVATSHCHSACAMRAKYYAGDVARPPYLRH